MRKKKRNVRYLESREEAKIFYQEVKLTLWYLEFLLGISGNSKSLRNIES